MCDIVPFFKKHSLSVSHSKVVRYCHENNKGVVQAEVASEVDPDVRKEREVDSDDDSTLEVKF